MRCPKCQYISFDSGTRCRNCGYDLSLSESPAVPDLPIQDGSEPIGPLAELTLQDSSNSVDRFPSAAPRPGDDPGTDPPLRSSLGRSAGGFDLPLFRDRPTSVRSESAVVTPPAVPRAPLSVRRPSAPIAKPHPRRPAPEDAAPRLALDTQEMPAVSAGGAGSAIAPAPFLPRLAGGAIDVAIMSGIDIVVVSFTLKICGLTFAELSRLPLAPLIAFLLLLNGGYLATFVAAAGQTIGKMATGLRVIPGHPDATATDRVPFGQAVLRAAAYGLSLLTAGLGFLAVVIGPERRALHDRLADTRVVKA
jgi:uncharacterized RDD family membrane protein YckC